MIFHLNKNVKVEKTSTPLSLRCPSCRQIGTFDAPVSEALAVGQGPNRRFLGQRRCPNRECRAHCFVVWDSIGHVVVSYPLERIDFDASDIPTTITEKLEEALICHASGAYTAAAVMVRRTLEEVCKDKRASGKNLQERIQALGATIILPPALLKGLDNLRLLGNDAAHVEAKTYDSIGQEEVEVAIDVTKEVLKAVYQMDSLVGRLEKLKKRSKSGP
jgi:hypothetical protein